MDIEVEGRADVGVPQQNADRLIVAVALNTAGCEAVAQGMEPHSWQSDFFQKALEVDPVCPWLRWLYIVRQNIEFTADDFLQRFQDGQQVSRNGNFPN